MDAIDFGSDYGYQDYTTASLEAGTFADQAWQAGDMDSYNQWNTTSWDAWNTGTDLYVAGADPFGTESPSTAEGYFPTTDTWSSYTGTDSTWSAAATDASWSAAATDSSWSASAE